MNYHYTKKDVDNILKNGLKVMSTFCCGGGSSFGYKLAGYDVIAANDIDPQMKAVYLANHNPKHFFLCPIKDLLTMDLPDELYNLDILDGSPPCSLFSRASTKRENFWGKEKAFREGQAVQVLDELFFDFIALADKLKPKIVIAENVEGIIESNARKYVIRINKELQKIGYKVDCYSRNSKKMGIPQSRQRVFFVAYRVELNFPKPNLEFDFPQITLGEVERLGYPKTGRVATETMAKWWRRTKVGDSFKSAHPDGNLFSSRKIAPNQIVPTITASRGGLYHYSEPKELSNETLTLCSSFPIDYDFGATDPKYILGMSVPPLMIYHISNQIKNNLCLKQ